MDDIFVARSDGRAGANPGTHVAEALGTREPNHEA